MGIFIKDIHWKGNCSFHLFNIIENDKNYKRYRNYGKRILILLGLILIVVIFFINRGWSGVEGNDEAWNLSGTIIVSVILFGIIYALIRRSKMGKKTGMIIFSPDHFEICLNSDAKERFLYDEMESVDFRTGYNSFLFNATTTAHIAPNSRIDILLKSGRKLELLIGFDKTEIPGMKQPNNLYHVFELIRKRNHELYVMLRHTVEINYLNENNYSNTQ